MIYELNEIKEIRKKYGLTQSELAKLADVSQSLIAKIESSRIDPTYTKIRKIFDAIDSLNEKKELKAKDVLNRNIYFLTPKDSLRDAINVMKKHEISQLPVFENKQIIGLISEADILESIMNKKNPESRVKELMRNAPPIISKEASINVVGSLLRYYPLVIVNDNGKTIGLITKSDMLRKVYN